MTVKLFYCVSVYLNSTFFIVDLKLLYGDFRCKTESHHGGLQQRFIVPSSLNPNLSHTGTQIQHFTLGHLTEIDREAVVGVHLCYCMYLLTSVLCFFKWLHIEAYLHN